MIGIQNIQRTQTTQSKDTIKEWARELNREFSTEEIKTYKKYLKKCSSSLALRLMQIKRVLRLHLSQSEWLRSKQLTTNTEEVVEKEKLLHCWSERKWAGPL